MKNAPESKNTTDDLPTFLHAGGATDANAEGGSPNDTESLDGEGDSTEPGATTAPDPTDAGESSGHGTPTTDIGRPPRNRKERTANAGSGSIGGLLFGAALVAAAVVLGVAPIAPAALESLSRLGVSSATLLVAGVVFLAAGSNRRHIAALQGRVDDLGGNTEDVTSLREGMQFLVESQHASNERPPAAGEELQHVLIALQRQDEKINNLTKAIKMYGKPLMEISGQGTELSGAITHIRTAVEAGNEAAKQTFGRMEKQLEAQLEAQTAPSKDAAAIQASLQKLHATMEAVQKKTGTMPTLEPLQQQVGRLEVAVAAIAQRVEDNELRKSLLRLEDATQKSREDVQQLLRGDGLQKATSQLQERLDKATGRLSDGLTQMRDGHLGGLESSLREIQREVSGVATSVAQIQAAVKAGGGRAAAAPTAAATPIAAPTPAPAPAAPTTPAVPAAASDAAGNTAYQTGTRSSAGKNVLGAIAKLKQMKT
ncbi:MAG: hypothetical protein JNK78_09385 [Planctomycetes bacterium]|nr:hypothetical protein [Planctomycetota bacterium]